MNIVHVQFRNNNSFFNVSNLSEKNSEQKK